MRNAVLLHLNNSSPILNVVGASWQAALLTQSTYAATNGMQHRFTNQSMGIGSMPWVGDQSCEDQVV